MTDSTAEDKPEPPPRQIEWLYFTGTAAPHGDTKVGVDVAVTRAMDPYVGDRLHVYTPSPLGADYVRYLTRRGDWADTKAGTQTGDAGFEMPPWFGEALKNAFQADVKRAREDAASAVEAAETVVETWQKVADLNLRTAETCVRRVDQLEREVEELRSELEDWREGRVKR